MADSLVPGAVTLLTSSMAILYTTPAATKSVVAYLHIVNTSGSAVTIRLCVVPTAGSPVVGNALMWDFSIPANDFLATGKGIMFPAGTTLQGSASVSSVAALKLDILESS